MAPIQIIPDEELKRIRDEYPLGVNCPTCGGELADAGEQDHNCVDQHRLAKLYFSANIGRRYHQLHWDDFVGPDADTIIPKLKPFVTSFDTKFHYGLGFVLSGPVGTGKTLLLSCVLKDLVRQGRDAYFIQANELINTWTSTWSDSTAKNKLEKRLMRCEVLGLDEMTLGVSDAQRDLIARGLEAVIRHRYNHALPTLITTNVEFNDGADNFPRIFSLLSAVNEWIPVRGNDFRPAGYRDRIKALDQKGERIPVV